MQPPYPYNPLPEVSPLWEERRKARRIGNSVGGVMLSISLLIIALSFGLGYWLTAFPEGIYLYNNPVFQWSYQILTSTFLYTVPFLFLLLFTKEKLGQVFAAKRVSFQVFAPLVMIILGVSALGNYGTAIVSQITDSFGIRGSSISDMAAPRDIWSFLLMLVGSAAVPALVEEFAMRGVVLGVARKYLGDTLAIFLSAFVFALMHNNLSSLPFTFLGGLSFAYVTVYAGSIWPAVVGHFLNNFLAALVSYGADFLPPSMADFAYLGYSFLYVALGLVGFVWLAKQKDTAFRPAGYSGQATQPRVLSWVLTSPLMVAYMAVFVIEVLLVWL